MLLTTDLFRLLIISSYHAPSRKVKDTRRSLQPNLLEATCTFRFFGVQPSPLYSIHTMMSPFWSLVVNFWYCSFQVTTCTAPECVWVTHRVISPKSTSLQSAFFNTLDAPYCHGNKTDLPLWPSRVWFMDRLLGAARPLTLASSTHNQAKINWHCSGNFEVEDLRIEIIDKCINFWLIYLIDRLMIH